MFKFFWTKQSAFSTCYKQDWRHNPSGHPALLQMSPRELADMPMVPELPVRMNDVPAKATRGCTEPTQNTCLA